GAVLGGLAFVFSSRRRHTRSKRDWSSDVCSSDLHHRVTVERTIGAHGEDGSRAHDDTVPSGHTPEVPRRCESIRWVSTMPTASIRAYMVVGPTKLNPSLRRALDSASDSLDLVGISAIVRGWGVLAGRKDQMKSAK